VRQSSTRLGYGGNVNDKRRAPHKIALFGELLVDHFPGHDVPGGAPFNVARHLRAFGTVAGISPILLTRIGRDATGQCLLDAMQDAGLTVDGVQIDDTHASGVVHVELLDSGHRFDILADQAWDYIDAESACAISRSHPPQWLYFGTLAQRAQSATALHSVADAVDAPGFLDLNLREPWITADVLRWSLNHATVVKMNDVELSRVAAMLDLGLDPGVRLGATSDTLLGMRLMHAFAIRRLIVTEGERGAWLLESDGTYLHTNDSPSVLNGIDSVGAGDGFSAVCLLGLALGWSIELMLNRAHRFAAEICTLRGAVPDNDGFYREFIDAWRLDTVAAS
jgi:fructokinase